MELITLILLAYYALSDSWPSIWLWVCVWLGRDSR